MVKRAALMLVASLALGFAGLYLVAGDQLLRTEIYRVRDFGLPIAGLIAVVFLAEWFLTPGARIWLLCRNQDVPLPYRTAILVHLAAMFGAALTPSNSGVGPLTAAALKRVGLPLGQGIGVALQVAVLDMVYFAWAVPVGLAYLVYSGAVPLPPGVAAAALAISLLSIAGAVFLSRYPRPVVRLILALAKLPFFSRFSVRLRRAARDYYRSARAFLKMSSAFWLALHAVTALGWFSGFTLLWMLMKLYGIDASLPITLAFLSSITLISHLVPTPGASGFMEAAVGLSIGVDPSGGGTAALVLWRLTSYHVIFLLGPPASWLLYLSHPVTNAEETSQHRRKSG